MANVIYRGPVAREPQTINLPVAGAYLPGTFVTSDGTEFTQADAATDRLLLLSNRRFYNQGPDEAYEADETGVAYRIEPDQEYSAAMAADTYSHGDALTVDSNGRLATATSGDLVIAYVDGDGGTLEAGDRHDVVIANTYTVPA